MGDKLLIGMLQAGKKACKIAQLCRAEKSLFEILVQEKGKLKSNSIDFKTLADVFIQQVAKAELEKEVPGIRDRVYGEENNQFTNTLGETICVEVKETVSQTASLLCKVVDGNRNAPGLMAEAAHCEAKISPDALLQKALGEMKRCQIDPSGVGIWIDPIDGTSQYVKGVETDNMDINKVFMCGLQCVTVLIGAYDIKTGEPIIGVVYQPFYSRSGTESEWTERCFWGVNYGTLKISNTESPNNKNAGKDKDSYLVIASSNDSLTCNSVSKVQGLALCTAGGAGYKCLCVIEGLADAWVYSDDACYKWDTCATQAILMSLGGSIVSMQSALKLKGSVTKDNLVESLLPHQFSYNGQNEPPASPYANIEGSIGFSGRTRSLECVERLISSLPAMQ